MKNLEPLLGETREHVLHQYGGDIGKRREELATPALVLDVDAAQRNIDHMAGALRAPGTGRHPAALQDAQEPGAGEAPGRGGGGGPVHRDRVGGRRAGRRRVRRHLRGQHRVAPGQGRPAGRAGGGAADPGGGGRGGQRRRAVRRGRPGRVRARDHGRGGHRHGPVRRGHRGRRRGAGPAGGRAARPEVRGHHRLRGPLLAHHRRHPAARAAAHRDDLLHRRRRAPGGGRDARARSGRPAASPPGSGPRPSPASPRSRPAATWSWTTTTARWRPGSSTR